MKAIRLTEIGQPLRLQDIPVPEPESGEVRVRVKAAGICRSDMHYRAGNSPVYPLPMTLGHEIAGVVEKIGDNVHMRKTGDRVCLHYLLSCGECPYCQSGNEQFCGRGSMLGHYTNGGYAEYITVPERNAVPLPDEIPFEHGAILMCSSATSFHALRKSRLVPGETVAVFGVGGLGISAIQLSFILGALDVYAVDIDPEKLKLAEKLGAIPVNAGECDPVGEIRKMTDGGTSVGLELIGLPETIRQTFQCVGFMGRAVVAGIADKPVEIDTYGELIGKEAELIGTNDHLLRELPLLLEFARRKKLDLSEAVTQTVPLDESAVNRTLDSLERFDSGLRTVIVP